MGKKAEQIAGMAREMFGTEQITVEQLAYITDMLTPSTFLLKHHHIDGKTMTFIAKDRAPAIQHRPWQIAIVNDPHPNMVVMKSRQLGISELNVGKLLHFVDTHSYDGVRALYA